MAPRNRTRLNLRIVDEGRRTTERPLASAPGVGDRTGDFLRAWRERRGWTIDQVAWVLRIRLVYLEAIEEDRFEELPGRIYVTGFVRSYARLLGVDEAAIVHHLRSQNPEIDRPKALIFPEPPAERAVPGGALTAVGIMVSVAVYAGWYYQTATSRSDRAFLDSVPSRLIATAEPSADGRGGSEQNTLPAAVPMQPPMRPPPARTVAANPSVGSPSNSTEGSFAVSSAPAPSWPVRAPTLDGGGPAAVDGRSSEVPRGDPPEAGAARGLDVALAGAGRTSAEYRGRESPSASAPMVAALEEGGDRQSGAALPTRNLSPGMSDEGRQREVPTGRLAAERQGVPALPELPSAEMADAYAATLPVDMIPVLRRRSVERSSPSASAAWAGSVDGMPGAQWTQAGIDHSGAFGPVVLNAVEATWIEVREETGQVVAGKLLQPGDSYTVPQRPGLKLTTGNAGGLEILVGGRQAPRVGPRGAVRRDIDLDGRLLLAGQGHSG